MPRPEPIPGKEEGRFCGLFAKPKRGWSSFCRDQFEVAAGTNDVTAVPVDGLVFNPLQLDGPSPERYAEFANINLEGVGMLSSSEVAAYGDEGLIIPSGFQLPDGMVNRLRVAVDRVVTLNSDMPSDQLINVHLDRAPPFHVHGDPAFSELVAHPGILDMVEQLIGPDIILWTTHLFCKPAATGREVPWHQDGHYWPIRPLSTCTAWVALDETARDNGALRYIPGSHKRGAFKHRTDMDPRLALHQVVEDPKFDDGTEKYVEMQPGQLSLHDIHILHGSAANTSGRRRAGLAIRYMPASSVLRRDLDMSENSRLDWSTIPLSLMRGEDISGANDLIVGHPR